MLCLRVDNWKSATAHPVHYSCDQCDTAQQNKIVPNGGTINEVQELNRQTIYIQNIADSLCLSFCILLTVQVLKLMTGTAGSYSAVYIEIFTAKSSIYKLKVF